MTLVRVGAGVSAVIVAGACSLTPIQLEAQRPLALRTTISAADGTTLARLYRENRALVSFEDIPQTLIDAVLGAEDARFFEHSGYDLRSIARAALVNLREGEVVQGGSTITQQYVKNVYFLGPREQAERTLQRKARELRLAIEIERLYSKDEILERYLNTVYLGEGAYGVKAAAETYFGHGVRTLSLAESALLAALIKAPAFYDPRDHPERALMRRDYVLGRMEELHAAVPAAADLARRAPLGVVRDPPRLSTRQPYFVEAVKREVLRDRRLGVTDAQRARALWQGGLRIETTLVPELQKAAEAAVGRVLGQPGDPEAALVAIRPGTGEIVAMVAGRDWDVSQVNLALGKQGGGSGRQPGSAFKPVAAASALEAGISFDTRYESSPATFTFADGSSWTVRNAEGGGGGLLPLDEAMVHSVNGVYARLALELGAGQIATQARLMGVRTKLPAVPSIALGSAEVSVVDMAAAYATLANYGSAIQPTTIRRIRLASGEVLKPDQERVEGAMSPGNAYLLTKVLQDVIARGTGRGADIGRPAAGKTGTTNDYADAWFVGYTPDLVAAVWVGYPQGRVPMTSVHGIRVFGGTFPAQIWREFMLAALADVPVHPFLFPRSELVVVEIDPVSGLLAAPWCPGERKKMLRQLAPTEYCPLPPPTPVPIPTATVEPSPSPTGEGSDRKKDQEREPSPEPDGKKGSPKPKPSPTD